MSEIVDFCGEYPENFVKQDILSDPNFVFPNDPSYPGVQLWDFNENTVIVNSFIECEYYVSGGWDNSPTKNLESALQTYVIVFVIVFLFTKNIFKRFANW